MPHFDTPLAAQRYNLRRRLEREAAASIYPNDKLRVRPTRYQAVGTRSGQILQFRPTEIIDDLHRIRVMDENQVDYVIVSLPPDEVEPAPDDVGGGPTGAPAIATIPNAAFATVPNIEIHAISNAPASFFAGAAEHTIPISFASIPASTSLATLPDVETNVVDVHRDEHAEAVATGEGMSEPSEADEEHEAEPAAKTPDPAPEWEPQE